MLNTIKYVIKISFQLFLFYVFNVVTENFKLQMWLTIMPFVVFLLDSTALNFLPKAASPRP